MPEKEKFSKLYSHSRISTFEQCPLKFKFRYIDKIIPEVGETIESHLGHVVHETLEWLYTQIKEKRIPSIDEMIEIFSGRWAASFSSEIVIVRSDLDVKDYFSKGVRFLLDYYQKHHPFNDNTLELEKEITLDLDEEGKYKIIGYIDRLAFNPITNEYEIHDYKTSGTLPSFEKINNDRQLALYSLAVKELFGKDKEVCLIWHYLNFNKKICSKRTNEQLEQLRKQTLESVKKIESAKDFPACKSGLCSWCEYKTICTEWN